MTLCSPAFLLVTQDRRREVIGSSAWALKTSSAVASQVLMANCRSPWTGPAISLSACKV
jgi:hypothetical protein